MVYLDGIAEGRAVHHSVTRPAALLPPYICGASLSPFHESNALSLLEGAAAERRNRLLAGGGGEVAGSCGAGGGGGGGGGGACAAPVTLSGVASTFAAPSG